MDLPFHERLRYERKKKSLSQEELAEALGCTPRTVGRWERAESLPQPFQLRKIYESFGLDPKDDMGISKSNVTDEDSADVAKQVINPPLPTPLMVLEREDWGEVPDIIQFYGRDEEQEILVDWITEQRNRVVGVLGVGGVGKTALSVEVARQVKQDFRYIFWRSLQNAPPLSLIIKQCLWLISDQQDHDISQDIDSQLSKLITYLRAQRCLLILDNVEAIFQPGQRAGQYRAGYQEYGKLFKRLGESQHQSCLLLTSREKVREVTQQEGTQSPVHTLTLGGVGQSEGGEILNSKGLAATDEQTEKLLHLYTGNPLALKLIAAPIHDVFGGNIDLFLKEERTVYQDINDLLEQQSQRQWRSGYQVLSKPTRKYLLVG